MPVSTGTARSLGMSPASRTKCGNIVVAAGRRKASFLGIGAFVGPCPWDCGAWITRGFRSIQRGQVEALRSEEWDRRPPSPVV